jgi:polyisoprenoid-binding protein YceI
MRYGILFGILALLPLRHAAAAQLNIEPAAGRAAVEIRTYGLGLLPVDGRFTRFHGRFSYDPANHAVCSVALRVDVTSIATDSATAGEMMLGPDFLDATRFPELAYDGACGATGLTGMLTMRGVTRPFGLTLDWGKHVVTAVGRLRREDWGMTARRLLVGSTVRITVTVVRDQEAAAGGQASAVARKPLTTSNQPPTIAQKLARPNTAHSAM